MTSNQITDWLYEQLASRQEHDKAIPFSADWTSQPSTVADTVFFPVGKDLHFTRKEIHSGRIGETIDRLMSLTDCEKTCAQNTSRMRLSFSGFNLQPHELSHINEVRQFFNAVTEQWPYWLHFLSPQPSNLAVWISLTFAPIHVRTDGEYNYTRLQVTEASKEIFQKMVSATVTLHDTFNAPSYVSKTMAQQLRHGMCMLMRA